VSCGKPCGCPTYRDHLLSIAFSQAAMPTRKPGVVAAENRENRWSKDMPAYRRLRENGVQPRQIDGSAELEAKASTQAEIEIGHAFKGHNLRDVQAIAEDTGLTEGIPNG
jgi:hypothetical protein